MTNPEEGKPNGAENDSTAVDIDLPDESKTQLINGGAGADDHPEKFKTAIIDPSDAEVSFNGLGKDEVLQYANDPFWVRLRWIMFILFWIGWLAMLVTAIAIIVLAPRCPHRADLKWYHTDNLYQVNAKSFKDSDNNGIGDFEGLKGKMDYITDDLETKALWLSSVYKADADGSGMGIIDHMTLDPLFVDDTEKFRSWVKKMRKDGKKVIMDLIPNQTSKKHPWFVKSVKQEGDYKEYYVWAEGANPPNDWKMVGSDSSAWTYDGTRKAWYLHQFSEDFPDLNLNNSKVVKEIKDIMKYWLDAGVSGFNIRDVEYLVENPDLTVNDDKDRNQTRNYMGTLTFLEELRKVAEDFSDKPGRERVLYATVYHANRAQIEAYWGTKKNKRLHIVAPFMEDLGNTACNANCVKDIVEKVISEEIEEEQWLGLQVGDQDMSRITSRLAESDPTNFEYRLVNAHALQLLLPGTPLVYYGDEFGQRNGAGPANDTDKFHSPMQWDNTDNAGFTGKGITPYIPLSADYKTDNVEVGQVIFKDMTPFVAYKTLTELRKEESFQFGKTKLCTVGDNVLMFSRHADRFPYFITLVNMGGMDVTVSSSDLKCLAVKDEAVVSFHSRDERVTDMLDMEDQSVHLKPFDVVVLRFAAED